MIIHNALCALPGESDLRRMSLRVRGERISALSPSLQPEPGEAVIEADALEAYPGCIDPHVHFDEPGYEQREDFFHGSMAAARGGVTTAIDMPCTSVPPVTTLAALRSKLAVVKARSVIDFALFGGVAAGTLDQSLGGAMEELAPWVVGFKAYFVSGMKTFAALDHYGFARAVREAARLGRPMLLHAEDASYVLPATEAERARSGTDADTWLSYVRSRPEAAETAAVAAALALAGDAASWLHIVHVGTANAAVLAGEGLPPPPGQTRIPATCETCPHYLAFSMEDFATRGASLKTAPPVKGKGHAASLWRMLEDGRIAFVASDHAPAPAAEKNTGSIWTAYGGIPGTGTLFPYLYSEGFKAGRLGLPAFLRATSGAAARRFGLEGRKGALAVGMDADIALVDPNGRREVHGGSLLSKGTITPFEGMSFRGSVRFTLVRGVTVWNAGEAERVGAEQAGISVHPGFGEHLTWGALWAK